MEQKESKKSFSMFARFTLNSSLVEVASTYTTNAALGFSLASCGIKCYRGACPLQVLSAWPGWVQCTYVYVIRSTYLGETCCRQEKVENCSPKWPRKIQRKILVTGEKITCPGMVPVLWKHAICAPIHGEHSILQTQEGPKAADWPRCWMKCRTSADSSYTTSQCPARAKASKKRTGCKLKEINYL